VTHAYTYVFGTNKKRKLAYAALQTNVLKRVYDLQRSTKKKEKKNKTKNHTEGIRQFCARDPNGFRCVHRKISFHPCTLL